MFRPEKHRQVCHRGHELLAAHPAGTAGAAGRPWGCVHTALTVSSAAEGEHPHSEGHAERGTEHSNGPGGLSCTEISMQMQTDARTAGCSFCYQSPCIVPLFSFSQGFLWQDERDRYL